MIDAHNDEQTVTVEGITLPPNEMHRIRLLVKKQEREPDIEIGGKASK